MRCARPPIVYLSDHPSGRLLPWVIAVMAYLAGLGLAGVITLDQSVANWRVALSHTVTVQITGPDEATREKERDAVIGLLKNTPGIESALPMSKSESGPCSSPIWARAMSPTICRSRR